jgi:putative colanic acid biosynthesis glycosyltransferase
VKNKQNILQINVRLTEGGAAGVALDLNNRLNKTRGYSSSFIYGYGKGAKPNEKEEELSAKHIGSKFKVMANFLTHKILNIDFFNPTGELRKELILQIKDSDIVHLHVVHSFFVSFSWLVDILIDSGKQIVWTLHDHWVVTGRCAFNDGCIKWKSGCGACPTLDNYPPVWLDRSGNVLAGKRKQILRLADAGCEFVSPSKHLFDEVKSIFPNIDIRLIHNSLDLVTESIIKSTVTADLPLRKVGKVRVLIIAHDLNYEGKTNLNLINKIKGEVELELHTIGKNSPFYGDDIINHGYVSAKKHLYEIYKNIDLMLFTSVVDNFPLVIGEALSIGVPVVASNSAAAKEVLCLVGGRVAESTDEIVTALRERDWMGCFYAGQTIEAVKNRAFSEFSGERLLSEYLSIYKK